eukprot:CAMPEP_0194083208 /NCGR_PEP_ID=MMETSP0149-20130528/8509_1 /TAXON_ID=122233 /ORGANISM="Chaetoceros debilis, Strain MM31A-1" /LENGTH=153 /DNA_ID=CAMNT_0038765553 /DNA_START=47 /DNA_END=508 /DNA_ORIENTATION=+
MNSTHLLRRLRSARLSSKITRRNFGAGQPESQSQQARLFEGHSTAPEGWEGPIYATYAAATVVITLALGFSPDTSINTWASNEARVRLQMKADGTLEKEEFGVHYNTPEKIGFFAEWDKFQMKAANPEEDDDDDDDDDEEEEEEEEDEEEEEE